MLIGGVMKGASPMGDFDLPGGMGGMDALVASRSALHGGRWGDHRGSVWDLLGSQFDSIWNPSETHSGFIVWRCNAAPPLFNTTARGWAPRACREGSARNHRYWK